jgi:hypothetical protein
LSDDDAELVLKYDATLNNNAGGYRTFDPLTDQIGVNDIFVGIVGITSFPTGALGQSQNLYNEISAIYAVQAISAVGAVAQSCGGSAAVGVVTSCTYYEFGAPTVGLNGALSLADSLYSIGAISFANTTGNSFASVQEDSTPDFDRTPVAGTEAAAFGSAADGIQRFVFDLINVGQTGGDSFFTFAPANVLELALFDATNQVPGVSPGSLGGRGTVSYSNVPGWTFGPFVAITGTLYSADAGPFVIHSDSTYTITAERIPEPASLALVGLALAGAGFASRKRKSQA